MSRRCRPGLNPQGTASTSGGGGGGITTGCVPRGFMPAEGCVDEHFLGELVSLGGYDNGFEGGVNDFMADLLTDDWVTDIPNWFVNSYVPTSTKSYSHGQEISTVEPDTGTYHLNAVPLLSDDQGTLQSAMFLALRQACATNHWFSGRVDEGDELEVAVRIRRDTQNHTWRMRFLYFDQAETTAIWGSQGTIGIDENYETFNITDTAPEGAYWVIAYLHRTTVPIDEPGWEAYIDNVSLTIS